MGVVPGFHLDKLSGYCCSDGRRVDSFDAAAGLHDDRRNDAGFEETKIHCVVLRMGNQSTESISEDTRGTHCQLECDHSCTLGDSSQSSRAIIAR
jgi:hypothetical protein